MVKKMDGLKISIDNQDEPVKAKSKTAPTAPKKVRAPRSSNGFMPTLMAVIITAVVVGGGIYAWKDREVERGLKDISQDARTTREEFENRINNLKNKLTGIETENQQLKSTKEELEKKVGYLNGATKVYFNEENGFSFLYPASFGEVVIQDQETATGTKFTGTFSENDQLVFGAVSQDYLADPAMALALFDNYGFKEDKDKVIYQSAIGDGENEFEIRPVKKIATKNGQAILVDRKSFPDNDNTPQIDLGENMGAVVNLSGEQQPSLSFVNSDFSRMTLLDFEAMLSTVE